MYINYTFPDTISQAKDYLRWLNLDEGVAYTTFTKTLRAISANISCQETKM